MSSMAKLGCVTTKRTSKIEYEWIFRNISSCGGTLRSSSPTFSDDGFHRISWRLELSRHPRVEYTPQYGGGYETYLTLIPTSGNIRPDLNIKCAVSILGNNGNAESGPHNMTRWDSKVPIYRCAPHVLSDENLRANQQSWLPDGHLKIRCQVEVSDCVADTSDGDYSIDNSWSQDFNRLFDNRAAFSDVILTVGHRHFTAHKVILATRSPVFAAMFQPDTKESLTNSVDVTGIDPDVFHEMLRFIYTNKADVSRDGAQSLLAAADMYQLEHLKKICERKLLEQLSLENAVQLLIIADRYSAGHLKNKVKAFINSSPSDIFGTEDWKTLTVQYPRLLADLYTSLFGYTNQSESSQSSSTRCSQSLVMERLSMNK